MKKSFKIIIFFIAAGVIIVSAHLYVENHREKALISKYSAVVTEYGFKYNVDANLILAVIKSESNFNENALSPKGAAGLMQILPSTGRFIAGKLNEDFTESGLYDYSINIKYGAYYLSYLKGRFSDFDCMLAAYNAGEGNVSYWLSKYSDDGMHLKEIPFKETQNYVIKVKEYYNKYRNKYNY